MMKTFEENSKHIVLIILFIILLIVPLLFLPSMRHLYDAPKFVFFKSVIIIAVGFQLIQFMNLRKIDFTINFLDIVFTIKPILLLMLFLFVDHYKTIPTTIHILIYLTIFYWLVRAVFSSFQSSDNIVSLIKLCLWIVLISCFVECIIGMFQFFRIIPYDGNILYDAVVYDSVVIGTMGNANSVGSYLAVTFPLLLGLYRLYNTKKKIKIIIGAGILLSLVVLTLTKSRGSWIALIMGVGIYYLSFLKNVWRRFNSRTVKIIQVAVFVLVLFILVLPLCLMNASSSMGRIFIWKTTFEMIKDQPLTGIGYGNYPLKYLSYQRTFFENPEHSIYFDNAANIRQAHNEFLEVFAETGIGGFLLYILLWISFYKIVSALNIYNEDDALSKLGRMFASSAAVVFFHSLFDSPSHFFPTNLILCFSFSLLSVLANHEQKMMVANAIRLKIQINKIKPYLRFSHVFVVLMLSGIGSVMLFHSVREAQGYCMWRDGQKYSRNGNWQKSIHEYQHALKYLPDQGRLYFHLAIAYHMNGQYESAIQYFDMAEVSFSNMSLYHLRATAYQKLKNYTSAEHDYNAVIQMFPNLLHPRLTLGKMYLESNQTQKAEKILRSILVIDPKIKNERTEWVQNSAQKLLVELNNSRVAGT